MVNQTAAAGMNEIQDVGLSAISHLDLTLSEIGSNWRVESQRSDKIGLRGVYGNSLNLVFNLSIILKLL